MKNFLLAFVFYYRDKLTKTLMIVLSAIFIVVLGGAWAFDNFGRATYTEVAIVHESSIFILDTEEMAFPAVNFELIEDLETAQAMFDDGDIDYIFIIRGGDRPALTMILHNFSMLGVETYIAGLLANLHIPEVIANYNVPPAAVMEILQPIEIDFETVQTEEEFIQALLIAPFFGTFLFAIIGISGQMTASSLSGEKSGRVMEIIITKLKPSTIILAKVLANLLGILQLLIPVFAGALLAEHLGFIDFIELRELITNFVTMDVLALGVIYIVLGYIFFALIYATAGIMASSIESLGTVTAPLSYVLMIPLILPNFMSLNSPLLTVLSFIPLFSPFITVQRLISNYAFEFEAYITIAILVISIILMFRISTKIFINAVSHHSDKKLTREDIKKFFQS